MSPILERIYGLMAERRMNAKYVSETLHLSNSSFTDWKKGKGSPSLDIIVKFADYFHVSMEYLMTGEERPEDSRESSLSPEDRILIEAYHKANIGIQESVCKLLDIKRDSILSEEVG